ncbi:MAG: PAS domain-containing sensor histidine kinase, partial [Planctomycetota bacterium]
MAKKQLFWQLYPLYLIMIILSLAAVGLYASSSVREFYLRQTAENLEAQARLAASHVSALEDLESMATLNPLYKNLAEKTGTRFTLILANGTVICDSEEDPARMENHANRPEVLEAQEDRTGISTRHSFTLDKEMMYVAIPLEREGTVEGVFRVSIPVTAVHEALGTIYFKIIAGGLV